MSEIRTRIAPSPTGDPHVGTAYIALFNLCFARQHGGKFLLRIEDTDQTRSTPESEQAILDSLRWLGLEWDEGPDVGGPHGPYRQSERMDIYGKYALELVEKGHAFYCFATAEELDEMRREQQARGETPRYDGRGLTLTSAEVQSRLDAGEPYVIRMKIPEEGVCEIDDMLRGKIEIEWSQVDMQVLLKADGMPTYHLANVVDDHLMQITHVIRGEEWINSAPKHLKLYEYFGWRAPVLCHLPLLRNPDKSKLSKRKNPTSILYYKRMGYLPEAMLNYLGRMGWSMPDEREKFTLVEMQEHFDLLRVSLGGPIFDVEKLSWLNSLWIRENFTIEQLAQRLHDWALNKDMLLQALPHAQSRMTTLSDFAPLAGFLVSGMMPVTEASFASNKLPVEQQKEFLQFALWRLEALRTWERDTLFAELKTLAEQMGLKIKDAIAPVFVAIAGSTASFPVVDSMQIIGPDMSRARIRHAINALGGFGKNKQKDLEKVFAKLSEQGEEPAVNH
ncbi:glutamate--tRNA ligase [Cellvibrio japonicus]|uniref:Glutamate--tRNA ligase n=1 Tax=Cellvibrio japonicus (strain Ueda107) TaxID=498211 RepID=SYE_CELJU|nr:glutamate--tRNA ligase [Cellvibrio japonicus]B3PD15.1 RecName: Full=Glutamate--tRNA ligase; AltName: Full=Glutamyl-tRNA synthetase; Short=GluRS [Cellvibrio japonicus Ueda107]ACE84018.1 glutamyl-tRNA synthetase [Cellvibrio japonicus Ueda107]QEI11955.1 glutamate--tRNA ligase [Cellvibrio japonicus]QEI15529.1 glutamate--tRNA ligase [Cellvibrio japonicus]QEI19108.1 glutamate--tRNA ligase [Cellvibrio japonicus]